MNMKKGQGSLEYLIIIAAVLAIAAVVIMYLTGILGGIPADYAKCQSTAANCASMRSGTPDFNCYDICSSSCLDGVGDDIMDPDYAVGDPCTEGVATACGYCMVGDKDSISPP